MSALPENNALFGGNAVNIPIPERERKGFHTLSFDDTELNLLGKKITLAEGFTELEKLASNKSPSFIAKKLVTFAFLYNNGLIGKDTAETEQKIRAYIEANTPKTTASTTPTAQDKTKKK